MSRNTILFVAAMAAIVVGLLVSYFPPPQNAVAIWSIVSMFIGYGIRDLFVVDKPAAPSALVPGTSVPIGSVATPAAASPTQQ